MDAAPNPVTADSAAPSASAGGAGVGAAPDQTHAAARTARAPRVTRRFRALVYIVTGLVAFFVWCWLRTLRVRTVGSVPPDDEPTIYATWHRNLIYAIFHWRWRNGVLMASASKDGEWAAGMIQRFGNRVVRGSSSRGGRAALEGLVEAIQAGASGGLLPDAPRGPARRSKPGILALAQRTGRPIVPVQFGAARALRLRSWDQTLVPLPFTRLIALYGEPFPVDPALEGEAFEARLAAFDQAMNDLADRADALAAG